MDNSIYDHILNKFLLQVKFFKEQMQKIPLDTLYNQTAADKTHVRELIETARKFRDC